MGSDEAAPLPRRRLTRRCSITMHLSAVAYVPTLVFAESTVRDPHALDEGNRLHTMVVRALTILYDRERPTGTAALRDLWACAGITDDELSSTVLLAGVPLRGISGPVPDIHVPRIVSRTASGNSVACPQFRGCRRKSAPTCTSIRPAARRGRSTRSFPGHPRADGAGLTVASPGKGA
ncbi:TIGR02679 domain-containing protein [Nocardia sp. NPDC002869]|uniref:TIGR02679 domain-containing protein n=1 Tax=Nocardia sp. NPDC002869 TaxID=3161032 RepID=UPI00398C9846